MGGEVVQVDNNYVHWRMKDGGGHEHFYMPRQCVERLATLLAVKEQARLVAARWTFNDDQQHAHTWHDWADTVPELKARLDATDALGALGRANQ